MSPEAGIKIGRLMAVKRVRTTKSGRGSIWLWLCDCGSEKEIISTSVTSGHTRSCGCLRREVTATNKTIHGNARRHSHSPEYRSWRGILTRCHNPSNPAYPDYGGRGISVCSRWRSFDAFLKDMGKKPTPKHSIERKKNDGNYEAGNCKWATPKEQANNRRIRRWKVRP